MSEKDISRLKPCTKHNYLLAFEQLDGRLIQAFSSFNFNHYLFGLRGYCQGIGGLDLRFYGGVCGVASQLFRAALTSPFLEIPTRYSHNERFAAYYGDRVEGDDAAVYETSKQLILKNHSSYDLLIKTFQAQEKTALIFVVPSQAVQGVWVEVQKTYPSPLEVKLVKDVYKQSSPSPAPIQVFPSYSPLPASDKVVQHLRSEAFESRYFQVNADSR